MKRYLKAFVVAAVLAGGGVAAMQPAMADQPRGKPGWQETRRDYDWRGGNEHNRRSEPYRFNGDRGKWGREGVVYVPARPVYAPQQVVSIGRSDRDVLYSYLRDQRFGGYSDKRYLVGAPLARNVVYYPVPGYVTSRLAPVPRGYDYVRVDNDVLLIDTLTRLVVDAVFTRS